MDPPFKNRTKPTFIKARSICSTSGYCRRPAIAGRLRRVWSASHPTETINNLDTEKKHNTEENLKGAKQQEIDEKRERREFDGDGHGSSATKEDPTSM
ncbi:hypothetical protein L1887_28825 [Cichorium endivia]|nr:hypothetical protein L1887_28825 [Cichorium endivia]